jgi:hypothetical protein
MYIVVLTTSYKSNYKGRKGSLGKPGQKKENAYLFYYGPVCGENGIRTVAEPHSSGIVATVRFHTEQSLQARLCDFPNFFSLAVLTCGS